MKKTFYSNGKLLITAEYLVLDGAQALALPTKFGQNLTVDDGDNHEIKWTSYDADGSIWFEETLLFSEIVSNISLEKESVKNTLITILREAHKLNPNIFLKSKGLTISTQLTFPRKWGLGTSSTLINNISQWFEIDAFVLLKNSFGGSGYDIACAQNDSPILYQIVNEKPNVQRVKFAPPFLNDLYFVYLNRKQNSKSAIASYREKKNNLESQKTEITQLTQQILNAQSADSFAVALEKHETILSSILETKTIKQNLFSDFNDTIKSLGAWGGDFVLVFSKENPQTYFQSRGYDIILKYEEMIL